MIAFSWINKDDRTVMGSALSVGKLNSQDGGFLNMWTRGHVDI